MDVALSGFTVSPSAADMIVTFGSSTSGISVGPVTITGLSSITVQITISASAPLLRDPVTVVETVSGGPGTLLTITVVAFTVTG